RHRRKRFVPARKSGHGRRTGGSLDMKNGHGGGRRVFLKGVGGATLGLPLLEYTHGKAWAADEAFAKRFVVVFAHGGETMCVHKDGGLGGSSRPSWDTPMPKIDHWLPKPGWKFGEAHEVFQGTDLEEKML